LLRYRCVGPCTLYPTCSVFWQIYEPLFRGRASRLLPVADEKGFSDCFEERSAAMRYTSWITHGRTRRVCSGLMIDVREVRMYDGCSCCCLILRARGRNNLMLLLSLWCYWSCYSTGIIVLPIMQAIVAWSYYMIYYKYNLPSIIYYILWTYLPFTYLLVYYSLHIRYYNLWIQ